MSLDLDTLDFAKGGGTITVIAVDDVSGRILMVANADREALERTLSTGEMHYRSRTRGLWRKGETSGNVQRVVALQSDCDGDAIVARVRPAGPACHTGARSCFGEEATSALLRLDATIAARSMNSDTESYTSRLLGDSNLRLKKIGEEAAELVHAAAVGDQGRVVEEVADLLYHALVVARSLGASLDDVSRVLDRRRTLPLHLHAAGTRHDD
jgi:phosphoribosyl-ATP pyrophosphohydrolase/phosphoribosyl-AMP cyclohydrolase